jgi:hypothetical protein
MLIGLSHPGDLHRADDGRLPAAMPTGLILYSGRQ